MIAGGIYAYRVGIHHGSHESAAEAHAEPGQVQAPVGSGEPQAPAHPPEGEAEPITPAADEGASEGTQNAPSSEQGDQSAQNSETAATVSAEEIAAGEKVYQANCQGCHQPSGQGIQNQFPPLAGHVPELLAAEGGREYLASVIVHGLQGQIRVKNDTYASAMPPFGQLSDTDVAALLNYTLSSWGNQLPAGQRPISAEDVQAQRATTRTPAEVLEMRPEVQ
nr:cytochrome c [Deinobacterium chartae]